jgi:biopolymer transport protein ExbB
MNSSQYSLLESGGIVMWFLLATSLFGFIIFIERLLLLHKGQIRSEAFLDGIRNLLDRDRLVEALTVCEETPGPVPALIKAALIHHHNGGSRLREVLTDAALVELPILERRIGAIAAIARIAPLLGLLGTVLGMIHVFFAIGGGPNPAYPLAAEFLGGLGQAMLTTAVGLVIAIMAHAAHHFLHGRVRALVHDMEYVGHQLLQMLQNPPTPPAHGHSAE